VSSAEHKREMQDLGQMYPTLGLLALDAGRSDRCAPRAHLECGNAVRCSASVRPVGATKGARPVPARATS
jgi:hypothetical protein